MKLLPCREKDATHVQILPSDSDCYEVMDVTVYGIYPLNFSDEGEEEITNDRGVVCCSFSCVLDVRWLKEVAE